MMGDHSIVLLQLHIQFKIHEGENLVFSLHSKVDFDAIQRIKISQSQASRKMMQRSSSPRP